MHRASRKQPMAHATPHHLGAIRQPATARHPVSPSTRLPFAFLSNSWLQTLRVHPFRKDLAITKLRYFAQFFAEDTRCQPSAPHGPSGSQIPAQATTGLWWVLLQWEAWDRQMHADRDTGQLRLLWLTAFPETEKPRCVEHSGVSGWGCPH